MEAPVDPTTVRPGGDPVRRISPARVARLFGKTRQGYHARFKDDARHTTAYADVKAAVLELVCAIRRIHPRMGTLKLWKKLQPALALRGLRIGRDALFTMLGAAGLLIYPRRPYHPQTTNSKHWMKKYSNRIKGLELTRPNQVWVSDITYVRLEPQWMYLSLISDAYSRKIVGYALSKDLSHVGPLQALKQALAQRTPQHDGSYLPLIHHSDRGVQYCCQPYVSLLQHHGVEISMTENGDPYENAIAERVNGILKYEYEIVEGFQSHNQAVRHIAQAVKAFNNDRPHASIDFLTPNQAHRSKGIIPRTWKINKRYSVK